MNYETGKSYGNYTAMMNINLSMKGQTRKQNGKVLLTALARMMQLAAPVVEEHEGKVIAVSEQGMAAIFERAAEDAVKCAVSLFQRAMSVTDISGAAEISIGIHYGGIYISPMRCGSFASTLAVSDDLTLTRSLSSFCREMDAHILLSEPAADHIPGFANRFGSRRIGLICREPERKELSVFDVFDGDDTEKKYSKRRSRLFFETGVDHFLSGRYLQSRSCFIELLKYDRSDRVAKRYITLCDKAISGQPGQTPEKYLGIL